MKKLNQLRNTLTAITLLVLTTSCSQNKNNEETINASSTSSEVLGVSQYNINSFPLNKLVCDPFSTDPLPSPKHGIKANLWYRGLNQSRYYNVMDYLLNTTHSEQNLFFSSINVPTRLFSSGFPIETGGSIENDSHEKLIEYFALKLESQLTLGSTSEPGTYELAVLSDDGAILKIKDPTSSSSAFETLINNDGDTPTKMKCASRLLEIGSDSRIPLELYYYQGPKYHIANMLIWRKVSSNSTPGSDPLCNHSGNKLFFDPDLDSKPLAWNDLVSRGWKVISPENFLLPSNNQDTSSSDSDSNYNACYQGEAPVISNFQVVEQLATDISFSWTTDIDSTGLMLITNLDTGVKTSTQTDNLLRRNHSILVTGLQPQTRYRFQAVSISNSLGRAFSTAIDVTTF